jgi:hypothetical protein
VTDVFKVGLCIFAIVDMNPLFIYLFAHIGGANLLHHIVHLFTGSLLSWAVDWTLDPALQLPLNPYRWPRLKTTS